MSGYRTLHRHEIRSHPQSKEEEKEGNLEPTWSVCFSPCNQTHLQSRMVTTSSDSTAPLRLLTSSADGIIRAYAIIDKSSISNKDVLDASALSMKLDQVLLSKANMTYPPSSEVSNLGLSLGCAALTVIRNYVGDDDRAGGELSAAVRLDGHISVWLRDEQPLYASNDSTDDSNLNSDVDVVRPNFEFCIKNSTGTSILLIPPQLTGYSAHGVIMMVGCLDGSVAFVCTGVGIPDIRKGNDTSKASESGMVLDNVGSGNSIPMSLALHPTAFLTFAVGRKNGTIDIYNSSPDGISSTSRDNVYGRFRRCHHLNHHAPSPIRALRYTPDGSLLISGCDEGHIYIHDMSSFQENRTVRMVAAILNAHKGYILSIDVLPDSSRFITSSADRTVKVWDVGAPNSGPVHTFETGHDKMIWDVTCSLDGRRCVSCSDDGRLQVYSCEV